MTGRNRARKCTIYLRMYIVPTCHSAHHYTANGVVTTRVPRCACIHASRPMLFSISRPSRAPPQDLSRLFPRHFFSRHFSRAHRLRPALRARARFHTRGPRAPPPPKCVHTRGRSTVACVPRRPRGRTKCARKTTARSRFFYLLTQRTSQCRIEILAICLPASQLIIKLSFTFAFSSRLLSSFVSPLARLRRRASALSNSLNSSLQAFQAQFHNYISR